VGYAFREPTGWKSARSFFMPLIELATLATIFPNCKISYKKYDTVIDFYFSDEALSLSFVHPALLEFLAVVQKALRGKEISD
jgi:hypothetical protein